MQHRTTAIVALACLYFVPGLLFFALASGAEDAAGFSAVIASPEEPGERLHVTGTVYGPDGSTPAAGVKVYAFHTDAEGLYSETDDNRNPRLKATVRTDTEGRYELHTIKPAGYPGGGVAAHIHYRVSGEGYPDQGFELHFEGDPALSSGTRTRSERAGKFGSVRPLARGEDGGWQVVFDMKLRR